MFDDIYDNGYKILGKAGVVLAYVEKNWVGTCENTFEVNYVVDTLKGLNYSDIVVVDYDNPMGYTVEYWTYNHKKNTF